MLSVIIPGPPQPQQRVKATMRGKHAGVYEPQASRSWKGTAQVLMLEAARAGEMTWGGDDPLSVSIVAVFACPTTAHRKRPVPRRWHTKAQGDADNIAKAVLDAGNGVLWNDDRQVAVLHVCKVIAAQGEAPYVLVTVRRAPEIIHAHGEME